MLLNYKFSKKFSSDEEKGARMFFWSGRQTPAPSTGNQLVFFIKGGSKNYVVLIFVLFSDVLL